MKTLGQIGYEAYCAHSDGKSLVIGERGEPLPAWADVTPEIKAAWEAAGNALWVFIQEHQS